MTVAAEEVKACCAAVYSSAAARFLLGDSFHPGGAALTSELIDALGVGPGDIVVDLACGLGTSTLQLARESGCDAIGVDLAPPAQPPGESSLRFLRGDAEALPLEDASADGILCECALCTFPDKERAAAEIARVLRPGGRLALSDMVADQERLPQELKQLQAWVACIADARPLDELAALLARAGLEVERAERRDEALTALIERIEARLQVAGMLVPAERLDEARALVTAAARAVAGGVLGYGVLVARRPVIESELWTRQLLRELRRARYRPRGWLPFLAASLARAREQRKHHRRAHRQLLALAAAGTLAWAAAAAAGPPGLALAGAGWWLAQALMADWHLGMLDSPGGESMRGLGRANALTLLRGGLPPALLALAGARVGVAVLLLAAAGDLADGRVARRRRESTPLGVWLDGATDTLVLGAATLGAALHGLLPVWAASLVLVRIVVPWTLAAGSYFARAERPPLDDLSAGRPVSLAAGTVLFAGLALAFLRLPAAAELTGIGAVTGMAVLFHRVTTAVA